MIQEIIIISPGVASDPPPPSSYSFINPSNSPQIPCPISPETTRPKRGRGPAGWSLSPNLPSNLYTPSSPKIPSNPSSLSPEANLPKQGRGPAGWSPPSTLSNSSTPTALPAEANHPKQGRGPAGWSPPSTLSNSSTPTSLTTEATHPKQGRGSAGWSPPCTLSNPTPSILSPQAKHSKQDSVPPFCTSSSSISGKYTFGSRDARLDNPSGLTTQSSGVQWTESDSRQPSVILNELVKLSRETKGEHFLPSLRRQEDKQRKCILCSVKGFRCLGNCCLGKKVLHNPSSGRKFPPPSTSIPGTEGDKSMTTSTLVSLQFFTDSDQSVPVPVCSSTTIKVDKKQIWDIFSWKPVNNGKKVENPDAKTPVHNHQNKKVANFGPAVFDTDDLDKIIKNSRFPKDPHTEKKKDTSFSKSNSTVTSLVRKLEISEKSCPRKNNDPTLPSSSNKLEFGEDQMKDHIPASSSDFKIPKLSSWGHYRVGLCGGSPYDSPTTAQVTSTSSLIPPAISAKIDNYNQFKCEFCNEFSTDTNTKLKRHKVGCKKKNRAKNRGSSIPRNKDDLTKNLAIGDTRESVAFESSPKTLSKLVLGSQNVLDLESSSSSNLNVGRIKLQVKTLKYNEEFHKVLEKSSATLYDKYMLCRAANICVPGMYPFINIRSSSNHYNSTSRYCFTDSKHLIDILKTSSDILSQSDRRRFILADTNIRISDIDIDFRGKELRPNAFMNIEVITTSNPNHIKFVLNNNEVADKEDPSDNEDDFSWPSITPEGKQISTQHCWGSDGGKES